MLADLRESIPPRFNFENLSNEGDNLQLRNAIESKLPLAVWQTSKVAQKFLGPDRLATCRNVHEFLRQNFLYLKDDDDEQVIQLPSELLRSMTGDCKSFALFADGIFINLNYPTYNAFSRSAYALPFRPIPTHIFSVVEDENGSAIIVDGTNRDFNKEVYSPYQFLNSLNMKIRSISDNLDVLADDILADNLCPEASKIFIQKLCNMSPQQRKAFVNKFSNGNIDKLKRSIQSAIKLNEMESTNENNYYVLGSKYLRPGFWELWNNGATWDVSYWQDIPGVTINDEVLADNEIIAGAFGDFLKNVGSKLAVAALAIPRGAFLGLVKLNFMGLSDKIKKVIFKQKREGNKITYPGWQKLGNVWTGFGGNMNVLMKAIGTTVEAVTRKQLLPDVSPFAFEIKSFPGWLREQYQPEFIKYYVSQREAGKETLPALLIALDYIKNKYNLSEPTTTGTNYTNEIKTIPDWIPKNKTQEFYTKYNEFRNAGMNTAEAINALIAHFAKQGIKPDDKPVITGTDYTGEIKTYPDWLPAKSRAEFASRYSALRNEGKSTVQAVIQTVAYMKSKLGINGISEPATGTALAVAATIMGAILGAMKPFLDSKDQKEVDELEKETATQETENKGFLAKVVEWVKDRPELADLAKNGLEKLEEKFSETGIDLNEIFGEKGNGGNGNGGNGNGGNGMSKTIPWVLGAGGLFYLFTRKKK